MPETKRGKTMKQTAAQRREREARYAKDDRDIQNIQNLIDRVLQEIHWWNATEGQTPGPFLIMHWFHSMSSQWFEERRVEHEKQSAKHAMSALKERLKRSGEAREQVRRIMISQLPAVKKAQAKAKAATSSVAAKPKRGRPRKASK